MLYLDLTKLEGLRGRERRKRVGNGLILLYDRELKSVVSFEDVIAVVNSLYMTTRLQNTLVFAKQKQGFQLGLIWSSFVYGVLAKITMFLADGHITHEKIRQELSGYYSPVNPRQGRRHWVNRLNSFALGDVKEEMVSEIKRLYRRSTLSQIRLEDSVVEKASKAMKRAKEMERKVPIIERAAVVFLFNRRICSSRKNGSRPVTIGDKQVVRSYLSCLKHVRRIRGGLTLRV
tara:strand:- start:22 stop:717 length:696 start_codon:yes stop_codon:yes gene_type:complete